MLARVAAASRRVSVTYVPTATSRTAARPHCFSTRNISLLPWRRNQAGQPPHVYFSGTAAHPRSSDWKWQVGRVIFTALTLSVCWQLYASVVFDPLLDWTENEWNSLSETERKEMTQSIDNKQLPTVFLPFPFTTKEVRQLPYKDSDPEWQTFIALNKDTKLLKEIRHSLAEQIRRALQDSPPYVKALGGKDVKIRKLWLDIMYPMYPPPKYYVSGIFVKGNIMGWGTQPIDPLAAQRLSKALYPKAVALATWTFCNSLFKQTTHDIAEALRMTTLPPPETTWQSVGLNPSTEQGVLGGSGKQAADASRQSGKSTTIIPRPTISDIIGIPISGESQVDARVQAALKSAISVFARNWQSVKHPPTRGCVRVDGLVELQGKNALIAIYVDSWYDPKEKRFMGIQMSMKHLVYLEQKPARN